MQYYNRTRLSPEEESRLFVEYAGSLEALLKTSDVVSINCPLTPETQGLISAEEFQKMKDGVILVNTGRGAVVDEAAFIAALESGKVARAGLDVFDREPNVK